MSGSLKPQVNATLLVLRHKKDGRLIDEVFRVNSDEVVVVVNGRTTLTVTNGRVFVDASKATVESIKIISSATPAPSPVDTSVPFTDPLTSSQHSAGWPPEPFYPGPDDNAEKVILCRFDEDGLHVGPGSNYAVLPRCFNLALDLGDADVSVTVRLVEDDRKAWPDGYEPDSGFGLAVRVNDCCSTVGFNIMSDGTWIDRTSYNSTVNHSKAIRKGVGATNRLRITMHGSHFEFFVNGVRIATRDLAGDNVAPSGGLLLTAGMFDSVVFSDLVVQPA